MYAALMRAQWKSMALPILLMALMAFSIPMLQLSFASVFRGQQFELAFSVLQSIAQSSPIYPLYAYFAGSLLGLAVWWDDFQGKHVYALTLPVPRWYYLVLRTAVGLSFLGVLVIALWLASIVAVAQVTLPPGLHAYPGGLAVRFALAATVAFSLTFALCSASPRVLRVVIWTLFAIIVGAIVLAIMGVTSPATWVMDRVLKWPGIVDVFTGRWMLIDV